MGENNKTDWFYVDWGTDIKAYSIETTTVQGVKMQRHLWLMHNGNIVKDKWIKGV